MINKTHLLQACDWAEKFKKTNKPIMINGFQKRYDQQVRGDNGPWCDIHGAAHLIAYGHEAGGNPSLDDYTDLTNIERALVLGVFRSYNGTPNQIRRILAGEHGVPDTVKVGMGTLIAPTTIIENNVIIGTDVHIAEGVYIGEGSKIGDQVTLGIHVKIKKQVHIKTNSTIQDYVTIGNLSEIGENVTIETSCVLDSDVSIDKHSEIGACSVLGHHVKVEKNCRISIYVKLHKNVEIGKNTKIGDYTEIKKKRNKKRRLLTVQQNKKGN